MSSNECRHKFRPRYTSGLADSDVLSQLAVTLLSNNCSEAIWFEFNRVVAEYRKAKVYVGEVCEKCGRRVDKGSS